MNLIDTIEISSGSRGTTIEFARLAEDGKTVANVKEYKPSKPLCEWLEELMHNNSETFVFEMPIILPGWISITFKVVRNPELQPA